ncbi:tetraacyldisaccharide 4'-kinase [Flavobacterium sp.]|uniref:tetraacyldisaccharide 4'-kinase n=1 Tax=Flavobacterium sp. TaxID=239 RepID=UPI00286DBBAE|nr:tetraacyldisaccharide 4'-kinase [Flavobacterium sp.]
MNFLRKLLFPFAILYGCITGFRNFLYDKGIFKSYSFAIPVIAVGNLSVGGTGKTPQIEYLIRLLSDKYKVSTLSRGYKRKSVGFVLADENATAEILGDEPFQFYKKFPNIQVAVDANRKNGIEQLLLQKNKPDIILLDDAFQHRRVKAGFYILLTTYNDLFTNDFIVPTGNLRESRVGSKRADVIVVTKSPNTLSDSEQIRIKKELKLKNNQQLYFSAIEYDNFVINNEKEIELSQIKDSDKLILAGIAKPESFFEYLKKDNDIVMKFPDHHNFTENDIIDIKNKSKDKIIITTEKDYVRLVDKLNSKALYYLPIKSTFITKGNYFDKTVLSYVV